MNDKINNPWEEGGDEPGPWEDSTKPRLVKERKAAPRNEKGNGSWNNFDRRMVKWGVLGLLVVWALSGVYQIHTNEQGVEMRFGAYVKTTEAGLNYHWPYPIETVEKVNITSERSINLGVAMNNMNNIPGRKSAANSNSIDYDSFTDSHMLTGDENIVDINLTVVWRIKNAQDYLFSVRSPDQTVQVASQSVLREIVGQSEMQPIITGDRGKVEDDTKEELQRLLDDFQSGIQIVRVKLQKADPPQQVIEAFNEVQRARADMERFRNEAEAYRNEVIPQARGEAEKRLQAAQAYRESVVNRATGEAERFTSVLEAFRGGREVTAKRLYLETMEEVLANSKKVIIDPSSRGSNVLPLLQLSSQKAKE